MANIAGGADVAEDHISRGTRGGSEPPLKLKEIWAIRTRLQQRAKRQVIVQVKVRHVGSAANRSRTPSLMQISPLNQRCTWRPSRRKALPAH